MNNATRTLKTLGLSAVISAAVFGATMTTETHEVTAFHPDYIEAVNTTDNEERFEDKPKLYTEYDEVMNVEEAQHGSTINAFYLRLPGEDLLLGAITTNGKDDE